jgi:hypothetical protein
MAAEQRAVPVHTERAENLLAAQTSPAGVVDEPSAGSRQAPLHAICARSVSVDSGFACCAYSWASSIGVLRHGADSRSLPRASTSSAYRSGFAAALGDAVQGRTTTDDKARPAARGVSLRV